MFKDGWRTTEFWITALTVIGLIFVSIASTLPEKWAAIAVSVSVAAYSISRGLSKLFSTTPQPPASPGNSAPAKE